MRIAEAGPGGLVAIDNHQDYAYRIVYVLDPEAVRRVVISGQSERAGHDLSGTAARRRAGCGQRRGERFRWSMGRHGCPGRAAAAGVSAAAAGRPAARAVIRGNARVARRAAMLGSRFAGAGEMTAAPGAAGARGGRPSRILGARIGAVSPAIHWPDYREMTLADIIAPVVRRGAIDERQSGSGPIQRVPRVGRRRQDCPACRVSRRGFPLSSGGLPEIFPSSALPTGCSGSGFQLPETFWKHLRPGDRFLSKLLWELCPLPHVMPGGKNPDKTARRKVRLRSASGCLVSMSETDL